MTYRAVAGRKDRTGREALKGKCNYLSLLHPRKLDGGATDKPGHHAGGNL